MAERYGVAHLSSGDILRAERARVRTRQNGRAVYGRRGMVPDDLIVDMMVGPSGRRRVVLDGFPRTVLQAEALDKSLAAEGRD